MWDLNVSVPDHCLSFYFTKNEFLQACLREIYYIAAIYEFQLKAKFIPGVENRISDYLSRWKISKNFQRLFFDIVKMRIVAALN